MTSVSINTKEAGHGVQVYIGLGSNLDAPKKQVTTAMTELDHLPQTRLVACSSLYRSKPMGPGDQPDYINAVALIDTELDPYTLLAELHQIEEEHGRIRLERWGARTLDLDILLYGEEIIESAELVIPHAGIHQRAFVLYPLQELVPEDFTVPGKGLLYDLLAGCPPDGLIRI